MKTVYSFFFSWFQHKDGDIVPHAQARGMENGNRISILQLGHSSFYLWIRMGDIVSYTKAIEILRMTTWEQDKACRINLVISLLVDGWCYLGQLRTLLKRILVLQCTIQIFKWKWPFCVVAVIDHINNRSRIYSYPIYIHSVFILNGLKF